MPQAQGRRSGAGVNNSSSVLEEEEEEEERFPDSLKRKSPPPLQSGRDLSLLLLRTSGQKGNRFFPPPPFPPHQDLEAQTLLRRRLHLSSRHERPSDALCIAFPGYERGRHGWRKQPCPSRNNLAFKLKFHASEKRGKKLRMPLLSLCLLTPHPPPRSPTDRLSFFVLPSIKVLMRLAASSVH